MFVKKIIAQSRALLEALFVLQCGLVIDNQRVTWTAFAMFYIWEPSQPIRIKSKFSDHLLLAIFL